MSLNAPPESDSAGHAALERRSSSDNPPTLTFSSPAFQSLPNTGPTFNPPPLSFAAAEHLQLMPTAFGSSPLPSSSAIPTSFGSSLIVPGSRKRKRKPNKKSGIDLTSRRSGSGTASNVDAAAVDESVTHEGTMYESGDYGGMDDMFAAGEDEDQVNGFLITSSASTYGPASKDNNDSSTDALRTYAEMIFESRSIYFARVDERCWVMEGVSKDLPQLGQFYHVTLYEGATSTGVEKMASCDCSQGKDGHNCLHKQVLLQHSDRFKEEIILSKDINPVAIEIAVHLHGRRAWFSVLSTQSSIQSHSQDGKRCIVSLLGSRRWTCSAPHCSSKLQPASTCVHRQRAEDFWINTIGLDAQGDGGEEDNEVDDADDLETITYDAVSVQAHVQLKPCSHRPVPPPPFCRLPSEPISAPVVAAAALPAVLPIGMHARCDCGQFSNLDEPRKRRSCTIYYSTGPVMRQIETQECKCRKGSEKRSIGPDLSEYGLFNWNNSVVVTHELFNSYSSQLSASSTPLTAFYTTTQHAYEQHCPDGRPKFLARSTFIKLYFAYVGLQQLDVSFSCSRCGPTPAIVIADGVVLAYSASLKHGNLSPPTTVGTERSNRARPQSISPFIPNALVRSAARAVAQAIDHGSADRLEALRVFTSALDSASSKFPLAITLWTRNFKQVLLDVCLASSLEPRLKSSLQHLIVQFSASDGILQLCRPLCKPLLMELSEIEISASTKQRCIHLSTTLSRHCPFLGNLLVIFAHRPLEALKTTESLFGSLQLLLGSTAEVVDYQMAILEPRTSPPPSLPLVTTPSIYTQTGTLYGSPQCRSRPFYPRLEEEVGGRSSEKQAIKESEDTSAVQCRKFYDDYVKRKRTGGIMALWCTHCICVGFHVIPHAEGRNDVFSAIFTHWPDPPSVIVYDFACQLGPYSLRREPHFFKDTLFVVDQMHEKGHTSCSQASRLSTYMRNDPNLQHVYSSAAECGNSGLSRIKKSVSYCNQEHAVSLVRVFLSIWNRRRMKS